MRPSTSDSDLEMGTLVPTPTPTSISDPPSSHSPSRRASDPPKRSIRVPTDLSPALLDPKHLSTISMAPSEAFDPPYLAHANVSTGTSFSIQDHVRPRIIDTGYDRLPGSPALSPSSSPSDRIQSFLSDPLSYLQAQVRSGALRLDTRAEPQLGPGAFMFDPRAFEEKQTLGFVVSHDCRRERVTRVYLDVLPRERGVEGLPGGLGETGRGGGERKSAFTRWWRHPWTKGPSRTPPDAKLSIAAAVTALMQILVLMLPWALDVGYDEDSFGSVFVWTYFFGTVFGLGVFVPTMAGLNVVNKEGVRRFWVSYAVFGLWVWENAAVCAASWFAAAAPIFLRWGLGGERAWRG